MSYCIGIDLGTSSVKVLLVNKQGEVCEAASEDYPLIQEKSGYNEQNPEDWVKQTQQALRKLLQSSGVKGEEIEGISFSGQMHGLVLLDDEQKPIRPAILWNDTRTTEQCRQIEEKLGADVVHITRNQPLEGFTLPKILWVQQNEPERFQKAATFLLPKDYLRFRMTGELGMDLSDAAGTLLLDIGQGGWSERLCNAFDLNLEFCPPLLQSLDQVGKVNREFAEQCGLSVSTKVFAGGADNACGAVGAGILQEGSFLCSIGTSGVILGYESSKEVQYDGKLHFFHHAQPNAFYAMGVTLSAGYSLNWFKETFAPKLGFDELLSPVVNVPVGSGGLLYAPFLVGERTPYADANIRGSFIGMDARHSRSHFARAVLEGITFSLKETIHLMREAGKDVKKVISIGGGAKNKEWLQIQADVFDAEIDTIKAEQGPGMGAAMLAATGCGWFKDLSECSSEFVQLEYAASPQATNVSAYEELFRIYRQIYPNTMDMSRALSAFRSL